MKFEDAANTLATWAARGKDVFTLGDLRVLFPGDREAAFSEGLRRLVRSGLLERAANGVYVYPFGTGDRGTRLERIASAVRRGALNYISLESALSIFGIISQVPIDHLTVMTTGRKGRVQTRWGTIEFTHSARPVVELVDGTVPTEGPLRLARPETALRDLRRVGRNTHLIQEDEVEEIISEFRSRNP